MLNILIEKSKSCILNLFKFMKFQLFIRLVLLVFCLSMMIASAKADYFEEGAEPGVLSSIKIKGKKTATRTSVVEMIAKVTLFEPLTAATKGVSPFSTLL